uniref:Uncharacterized protein n=1 Tax=Timema monikensis TaxID=170555 RepID=A0A7R9EIX4_9NEOP|nr:unnamed protein product [Timema monikensis]
MPRYCPVEQGHTGRMYSPCPEHRALTGVDQRSWFTRVTSQGKQGVQVLPLRENKERVQAKDPPAHYLNKLRTYLDPKASRSSRVSTPAMFP